MKGRWRVYFNSFTEAPLCWSVDSGEGTKEFKFARIHIQKNCDVISRVEPLNRGSEEKPSAWFEVKGRFVPAGPLGLFE